MKRCEEQTADPFEVWEQACERARKAPHEVYHHDPSLCVETTIAAAEDLLGLARTLAGIACPRCRGIGTVVHGSTACSGGAGGMVPTPGPCRRCRGTGLARVQPPVTGPDLSDLFEELRSKTESCAISWCAQGDYSFSDGVDRRGVSFFEVGASPAEALERALRVVSKRDEE
jgi:hypothetical protein